MDRLDYSSCKYFLYLLSEGLLKMDWYGPAGCLFRCNGQIYMNMVWFTWKSAYAFKEFCLLFLNLFFCHDDSDFLWCVFLGNYGFRNGYYGFKIWMDFIYTLLLLCRCRLCMYLLFRIISCTGYESHLVGDTQVWVLHPGVVTGKLSLMTGGHCLLPLQCKSLLLQVALCLCLT